jgi:hypothetical protein
MYDDYDPTEDADSEIAGYYPDFSAQPGTDRYCRPQTFEFIPSWRLAIYNAELPTV